MTTHLFTLGQTVRMKNGYQPSGDIYLITALLPPGDDSPQYRLRNIAERFERMATEVNLEIVSVAAAGESTT